MRQTAEAGTSVFTVLPVTGTCAPFGRLKKGMLMGFVFQAGLRIFKSSTETFVRESDGRMDGPGEDEYISFVIDVKNASGVNQPVKGPFVRIDGGEKLCWQSFVMAPGQVSALHVYGAHMEKLQPGTHKAEYYQNGALVYTAHFHLIRPWKKDMCFPTARQIAEARGAARAPYIGYTTPIPGVDSITEYAVDFWIDDLDNGTYFSALSWWMDVSGLEKRYASLSNEYTSPGSGYCGFQRWGGGETAVIMSVWDIFCKDEAGRRTVIRAKELYPGKANSCQGSEGSFQQFLVQYPWQPQRPYRLLMRQSASKDTGNSVLTMWVCDLVTMAWNKLAAFDLGYRSAGMHAWSVGGFLENYEPDYAGSVRNVCFANVRGRDAATGRWIAAKNTKFHINNSVPAIGSSNRYHGSCRFGADDAAFWIVTSGVPGLCETPENNAAFSVNTASEDSPY